MTTIHSVRQRLFLAFLTFLIVLVVSAASDIILIRRPSWIVVDDLMMAAFPAVLVYRYERQRSNFLEEKLRVIRDMNAFVRNELQVLYASLEHPTEQSMQTIERSVDRIDWALRELLPGHSFLDAPSTGGKGGIFEVKK